MTEVANDTNTGLCIGYARCSTEKQDLRAQKHELGKLNPDHVYTDEGFSGTKRDSRHGLDQALAALRAGDTLVVTKLDRLARSVPDARAIAAEVEGKGARIQIGGQLYDPYDPMGKMFFNMLATFAEFEADIARMRTREGMAEARRAGKLKGRKPSLSEKQQAEIVRMKQSGDYTVTEIGELFNVSRPTVYRALERTRAAESEDGQLPGQYSIPIPAKTQHGIDRTTPETRHEASARASRVGRRTDLTSNETGRSPLAEAVVTSRYTSEQINDYQLEKVVGPSGETTGYRVLIAGDVLGTIERVQGRTKAWRALDTNRSAMPHVGRGNYADDRQSAVVDLLSGLGVA